MPSPTPARTPTRGTRMTVYGRRRRRLSLGAVLALSLAAAAFAAAPRAVNGKDRTLNDDRTPSHDGTLSEDRAYLSVVSWPQQGQAAFVLGNGAPAASPNEQPVPITSLAKVMTAYLTLERYPLSGAQDGFTIAVTPAQGQAVSGRQLTAIGVVMGQGQGNDTSMLLASAGEAAQQLVQSVAPATSVRTIPAPGRSGARGTPGGRSPLAVSVAARPRADVTQITTRGRKHD